VAGVDRERGPELVAVLGEQHFASGREGAVEDCKAADGGRVGASSTANGDVLHGGLLCLLVRSLSKHDRQFAS
jgi:hypothetical protein